MSEFITHGNFAWFELMTKDHNAAIEFYTQVVGWTAIPFSPSQHDYMMWAGSQGPMGGTMSLPCELVERGVPPHWTSNVVVEDLKQAVETVQRLGGRILKDPEEVPGVGSFAVIMDPQGATLNLYTPASPMQAHNLELPGEVCWCELMTSDMPAGFDFYAEVFGWEKNGGMDMGPMGEYRFYGPKGKTLGGMFKAPPGAPSCWIYYIHVADLDASLARAKALGAQLVHGPQVVPGGDRIVQMIDPQGAHFALHGTGLGEQAPDHQGCVQ